MGDLIERLEAATVGSRELDLAIGRAFNFPMVSRWGDHEWRPDGVGIWTTLPKFTTSLDAALALAERVLPGLDIDLEIRPAPEGLRTDAVIYSHGYGPTPGVSFRAWAATPALALCAAILRAIPEDKS